MYIELFYTYMGCVMIKKNLNKLILHDNFTIQYYNNNNKKKKCRER